MRILICALVLTALSAGPALSDEAASAAARGKDAAAKARTLYVCDASTMTKRAFVREFGAIEFVKAEAAVSGGEAWSTPKCITPSEARRLKQMGGARRVSGV